MKNNILVEVPNDKISLKVPLNDSKIYFSCLQSMLKRKKIFEHATNYTKKMSNIKDSLSNLIISAHDSNILIENIDKKENFEKIIEDCLQKYSGASTNKNNIIMYYNELRKNILTENEVNDLSTSSGKKILMLGVSGLCFPLLYYIFKRIENTQDYSLKLAIPISSFSILFFVYKYIDEYMISTKLKKIILDINKKYKEALPEIFEE